jgi:hypothetical protein
MSYHADWSRCRIESQEIRERQKMFEKLRCKTYARMTFCGEIITDHNGGLWCAQLSKLCQWLVVAAKTYKFK